MVIAGLDRGIRAENVQVLAYECVYRVDGKNRRRAEVPGIGSRRPPDRPIDPKKDPTEGLRHT